MAFSFNSPESEIGTRQSKTGNCFTLIKLLLTIAIIAILAGLLLTALKGAKDEETDCAKECRKLLKAGFKGYIQLFQMKMQLITFVFIKT